MLFEQLGSSWATLILFFSDGCETLRGEGLRVVFLVPWGLQHKPLHSWDKVKSTWVWFWGPWWSFLNWGRSVRENWSTLMDTVLQLLKETQVALRRLLELRFNRSKVMNLLFFNIYAVLWVFLFLILCLQGMPSCAFQLFGAFFIDVKPRIPYPNIRGIWIAI